MSSQVLSPVETGRGSVIGSAEAAALSALYDERPTGAKPEWCDLTPDVEVRPDGGEGFFGVRIT